MVQTLVSQHCKSCNRDFYTSRIRGIWKKIDSAMHELKLVGSRRCLFCRSSKLGKAFFDNGGMLIIEEEGQV
jgi:hypothetical protein